jgi:PPM family protein phosphatase
MLLMEAVSDPGKVRPLNEDCISTRPPRGIVVLADGMGGYNAGEVASALAVALITRGLESSWPQLAINCSREESKLKAEKLFRDEIQFANESIFRKALQDPNCSGMGTTLVSALFHDNFIIAAHIGDSRLYRLRNGELSQITKDHSLLQEQLDAGLISAEEARVSNNKNYVTRALGVDPIAEPDVNCYEALPADIYLFCSDGLNDLITDEEIRLTLTAWSGQPAISASQLVQAANDSGGRDNISVVVVKVLRDYGVARGRAKS